MDTFQYTARDAGSLDSVVTGIVTMNVSGMVWYVDSSYGGGNGAADGSNCPFTSLTPLHDAAAEQAMRIRLATRFLLMRAARPTPAALSLIYGTC